MRPHGSLPSASSLRIATPAGDPALHGGIRSALKLADPAI